MKLYNRISFYKNGSKRWSQQMKTKNNKTFKWQKGVETWQLTVKQYEIVNKIGVISLDQFSSGAERMLTKNRQQTTSKNLSANSIPIKLTSDRQWQAQVKRSHKPKKAWSWLHMLKLKCNVTTVHFVASDLWRGIPSCTVDCVSGVTGGESANWAVCP